MCAFLRSALRSLMLVAMAGMAQAQTIVVNVPGGDTTGLIQAVKGASGTANMQTRINLGAGDFFFNPGFAPAEGIIVPGWVTISGSGNRGTRLRAASTTPNNGSLFVVPSGSTLQIDNLQIDGFRSNGSGGAIRVQGGTTTVTNSTLSNNQAAAEGGAIFINSGTLTLSGNTISGNRATLVGGGVSAAAPTPRLFVSYNYFHDNSAGVFGCDINVDTQRVPLPAGIFIGNQLDGPGCDNVRVENPDGNLLWFSNTSNVEALVRVLDSTSSSTQLLGNFWVFNNQVPQQNLAKTLCADFGSGALRSLGANIATDSSCFLNAATDLITQTPGLGARDANGIIPTTAASPAIERGPASVQTLNIEGTTVRTLPCGYRDIRGLGRPQDANLDGVFACDTGAYETQGGPNVGNALSASYYDTTRSGEGSFIESIGGGKAVVATFTYAPGGGLAWMTGVGNIVGNSVVVDELATTSGGVFGAAFNPANVVRRPVGSASFVFPSCEGGAQSGQWVFQGRAGSGYEDLIAKASRLSSPIPCSGNPSPNVGKSGSFYSTARSGEGVFLQFLPNGSAVVIWYTYDPQGRQFWAFASDVTVNGNTVTANMVYPAQSTRFGSQFNASQVQFAPWGTVTMNYSGCNAMTFAYNSTVGGFGSGQYNYTRLTTLQGASCQ